MNTVNFTLEEKEKYIDKLLLFFKEEIENVGSKIDQIWFNFHTKCASWDEEDGEDFIKFKEISSLSNAEINKIINICISNEYLSGRPHRLQLTRQGYARANSVEKAKLYKPNESNANFNFHGTVNLNNSQIGNNNQLQIHIVNDLENLLKYIENSSATTDEKKEAKNLLLAFMKHPLITNTVGKVLDLLIKSHFGG